MKYICHESENCKELLVINPPKHAPQYGGRTLVEKVTAYKLSDGELTESKEKALNWQKGLDREFRIDRLVKRYLNPFMAVRVGETHKIKAVTVWDVSRLLEHVKELAKEIE